MGDNERIIAKDVFYDVPEDLKEAPRVTSSKILNEIISLSKNIIKPPFFI